MVEPAVYPKAVLLFPIVFDQVPLSYCCVIISDCVGIKSSYPIAVLFNPVVLE